MKNYVARAIQKWTSHLWDIKCNGGTRQKLEWDTLVFTWMILAQKEVYNTSICQREN